MNAVELEGYPSNYFVQVGSKMLLLNMYVDDLTLSGDATLHRAFWQEMRKHINIEPEVYIGKEGSRFLGGNHCAIHEVQTSWMYFGMRRSAAQTVEFYCDLCGIEMKTLKHVTSPAHPEEEASEQGTFRGYAAQVLVRLLCWHG